MAFDGDSSLDTAQGQCVQILGAKLIDFIYGRGPDDPDSLERDVVNRVEAASDAALETGRRLARGEFWIEDFSRIIATGNRESRREMAAQLVRERERQTADQNRGPPLYRQVEEVTNDGEPWRVIARMKQFR